METKLSTGTFVGIVISLIATMSSILTLAATGWQMFPSMVMIASTLCPLFGVMIGQDQLGDNHWFTLAFIIVFYWLITLLNLKFDMAKIGGAIGI